jgi:hypothetical protein
VQGSIPPCPIISPNANPRRRVPRRTVYWVRLCLANSAISAVERGTGRASRGGLSPFLRPHPRPVPVLYDGLARARTALSDENLRRDLTAAVALALARRARMSQMQSMAGARPGVQSSTGQPGATLCTKNRVHSLSQRADRSRAVLRHPRQQIVTAYGSSWSAAQTGTHRLPASGGVSHSRCSKAMRTGGPTERQCRNRDTSSGGIGATPEYPPRVRRCATIKAPEKGTQLGRKHSQPLRNRWFA